MPTASTRCNRRHSFTRFAATTPSAPPSYWRRGRRHVSWTAMGRCPCLTLHAMAWMQQCACWCLARRMLTGRMPMGAPPFSLQSAKRAPRRLFFCSTCVAPGRLATAIRPLLMTDAGTETLWTWPQTGDSPRWCSGLRPRPSAADWSCCGAVRSWLQLAPGRQTRWTLPRSMARPRAPAMPTAAPHCITRLSAATSTRSPAAPGCSRSTVPTPKRKMGARRLRSLGPLARVMRSASHFCLDAAVTRSWPTSKARRRSSLLHGLAVRGPLASC
mmetsp:Transcript_77648/g.219594  ORF Transcript_77648/g.219594 Transcript_77648/m.219594 type:complete len:272 (-) Transcript_77648:1004-1819(-)